MTSRYGYVPLVLLCRNRLDTPEQIYETGVSTVTYNQLI